MVEQEQHRQAEQRRIVEQEKAEQRRIAEQEMAERRRIVEQYRRTEQRRIAEQEQYRQAEHHRQAVERRYVEQEMTEEGCHNAERRMQIEQEVDVRQIASQLLSAADDVTPTGFSHNADAFSTPTVPIKKSNIHQSHIQDRTVSRL